MKKFSDIFKWDEEKHPRHPAGDPQGGEFAPSGGGSGSSGTQGPRSISSIAADISREWRKQKGGVNYAAKPYLEAMFSLENINDNYSQDSARSVIAYFLGNAHGFKGPEAKKLKEELKALLKPAKKYESVFKKFNPHQPRAPKGTPQGGQWVAGGRYHIAQVVEDDAGSPKYRIEQIVEQENKPNEVRPMLPNTFYHTREEAQAAIDANTLPNVRGDLLAATLGVGANRQRRSGETETQYNARRIAESIQADNPGMTMEQARNAEQRRYIRGLRNLAAGRR